MGEPTNASWVRDAVKNGLLTPEQVGEAKAQGRKSPGLLVAPAFRPGVGRAEWVVAVKLDPATNGGAFKRGMIGVAAKHRRAVARAFAPTLRYLARYADAAQAGRLVTCRVVRIGGGRMDAHDGLPAACKWVVDTVALFLGVDDGLGPVRWEYGQEPGGPMGVRIVLSVEAT